MIVKALLKRMSRKMVSMMGRSFRFLFPMGNEVEYDTMQAYIPILVYFVSETGQSLEYF